MINCWFTQDACSVSVLEASKCGKSLFKYKTVNTGLSAHEISFLCAVLWLSFSLCLTPVFVPQFIVISAKKNTVCECDQKQNVIKVCIF